MYGTVQYGNLPETRKGERLYQFWAACQIIQIFETFAAGNNSK